jgi:hypothetical protein
MTAAAAARSDALSKGAYALAVSPDGHTHRTKLKPGTHTLTIRAGGGASRRLTFTIVK